VSGGDLLEKVTAHDLDAICNASGSEEFRGLSDDVRLIEGDTAQPGSVREQAFEQEAVAAANIDDRAVIGPVEERQRGGEQQVGAAPHVVIEFRGNPRVRRQPVPVPLTKVRRKRRFTCPQGVIRLGPCVNLPSLKLARPAMLAGSSGRKRRPRTVSR